MRKLCLLFIVLFLVVIVSNVEAKTKRNRKHCEHTPTPTPIVTATPTATPTPINETNNNYVPFNQIFEVAYSSIKDGDVQVGTITVPIIEMSMSVNGDRLGEEAFELRIVLERDYDTLILGESVNIIPELYSVNQNGTNARHIKLHLDEELQAYTSYRLIIKQDQHLIAANNAGDTLQKDYIVYFTTGV